MQSLLVSGLIRPGLGEINFELNAGDRACVSGPSGSGKTLLLRSLADLDPHQGSVLLDSAPCDSIPPPTWRRRVGLLPADSAWWSDRVAANLPPGTEDWFDRLGLPAEIVQSAVARLSSGERQRLALARLLALSPEVLLLDEPTAHLDAGNQQRIETALRAYVEQGSASVIWVSHDPAQVERIGNRHWRMADGELTVDR